MGSAPRTSARLRSTQTSTSAAIRRASASPTLRRSSSGWRASSWLASVQTYESDRYDFDLPTLLRNVATNCPDGGASCTNAVKALNDATSGLVNRGCPSGTACSTGAVDGL